MSDDKAPGSRIIEFGTNDLVWCHEHGRYEQFSTITADGVTTATAWHHPLPINPETGLP